MVHAKYAMIPIYIDATIVNILYYNLLDTLLHYLHA